MNTAVPAAAAAVAALFTVALVRRYHARGRVNRALLWWAVSLGMFTLAALGLATGEAAGWSSGWFRIYYLFGGVLVVPWLALGSVQVAAADRVTTRALGISALAVAGALVVPALRADAPVLYLVGVGLGVVWGALLLTTEGEASTAGSLVIVATLTAVSALLVLTGRLAAEVPVDRLPEGSELFGADVRGFAVGGNAVGAVLVVVGAVVAAIRLRGAGRPGLVVGNLLIALGVLVSASGGLFAFVGDTEGHAIAFAVGVAVMYAGFVRTTGGGVAAERAGRG